MSAGSYLETRGKTRWPRGKSTDVAPQSVNWQQRILFEQQIRLQTTAQRSDIELVIIRNLQVNRIQPLAEQDFEIKFALGAALHSKEMEGWKVAAILRPRFANFFFSEDFVIRSCREGLYEKIGGHENCATYMILRTGEVVLLVKKAQKITLNSLRSIVIQEPIQSSKKKKQQRNGENISKKTTKKKVVT